ncbi:MAG TPA: PQQ-binding-like beta-propeller repeat protein [Acidimicrobiia bacterium]|nr:PQQ-binding-like beta-propeller repeat protein [Acidimicrobiia bacterium]
MLSRRLSLFSAALVLTIASGTTAAFGAPSWPVYNGNAQRTGNDTSEPVLLPIHGAWSHTLDGAVYAQPLAFDGRVFTATENDTVYALDAHDGAILWSRHLGTPMTNVSAQSGCGNVDPLGILSTPVIDTARHTIFVVATIEDSFAHIHHQLVGLDTLTGALNVSTDADPGGVQNNLNIQQRAGLALGNGRVYIGYGGYAGDCGPYHGWLVSLTEGGTGKVAFNVTPHSGLGAIWATGGATIDAHGNVFVATGNPDPDNNGDFGESVLKFDSSPAMHRTGAFKTFPGDDNDLSSVAPSILPNNMVFQIGKQQTGFLIDTTTMTQLQSLTMCVGVNADGTNAWDGSHLYVPCANHIQQVNVDVAHRTMSLGWVGPGVGAAGSPILAGGSLWSIDRASGTLYALNPATGAVRTTVSLGPVPHFAAPAAALGLVIVPTLSGIKAFAGPSGVPPHAPDACRAQTTHTGYWVAGVDGNVYPFGGAPSCGSLVGLALSQPIVGMTGRSSPGYWLVARDGGIFSFGTARYHGSMGGHHLNQPIVGMATTPSGNGYWLVARDGGIFSFGDARFHGSTGAIHLNQPIVGMAATPSGRGYWLVARDGGIFAFGDARFRGSMGGRPLNLPVVGMARTPSGAGYWLVASDGGVFSFGDARFHGSTGAFHLTSPIVGMEANGRGYRFVAGDGGVFSFGLPSAGSASGTITAPVIAIAHD